MIVDDEEDLRKVLSQRLKKKGYKTIVAKDGLDAIEILKGQNVDLILSDVRMPNLGGLGLAKWVQQSEQKGVPLVFISGYSDICKNEARENGVVDFLAKPIDAKAVFEKVQSLINN